MLLTQWVNESPSVVAALLQLPKFIPLLLELIENKGRCVSVCQYVGVREV